MENDEFFDEEEEAVVEEKQEIKIPQADSSILMTPPMKIEGRPPRINKERVQLRDIKGSFRDNQLFDRFFRPKIINKRIRRIYEWIAEQQRTRRSFNGISLTKLSDREYYVYEGVRRVSALKNLGWREIDVGVADFSYLKTGHGPRRPPGTIRRQGPEERTGSRPGEFFAPPRIGKPSEIKTDPRRSRQRTDDKY